MSFKDLFVASELEPEKPKPASPQVNISLSSRTYPSSLQAPVTYDNSASYQRLLRNTDEKTLPVYNQVRRFMDPLIGVIADESTRFKAAVAQAAASTDTAKGGFKAYFLESFNTLFTKLDSERKGFESFVEQKIQKDIKSKESALITINDQISAAQLQIETLTAEKSNLLAEIKASQQSIDTTTTEFNSAYELRKSELERKKVEYQTLLT